MQKKYISSLNSNFNKALKVLSIVLILSLITGQMLKFSIGKESGKVFSFLFFELITFLLIFVWFAKKFFTKERLFPNLKINKPITAFISIGLFSLILGGLGFDLSISQFLSSSLYLVRWVGYALIFYIYLDLFKDNKFKKRVFDLLIFVFASIVLLGILQYFFLPNVKDILSVFTYMKQYIWDPHILRLVSTFMDPNLLAGFFIIFISILSIYLKEQDTNKRVNSVLIFLGTAALTLTYSRSGYLSLLILLFVLFYKKMFKAAVVIIFSLILVSPLYFQGIAKRSIASVKTTQYVIEQNKDDAPVSEEKKEQIDFSGLARIKSWGDTIIIIKDNPIFGVGFNNYFYATEKYSLHRTYGSDSSLLFVIATTGIAGLFAYAYLLKNMYLEIKQVYSSGKDKYSRTLSLSFLIFFPILLVHSVFTNSLFYPQIMISLWIILALIYSSKLYNVEQDN